MENYNPNEKSSYLLYLDANNLCGWAMKQKLPYSDFKYITEKELNELIEKKDNGEKEAIEYFKKHNRIWEVDLEYDDECKLKTYKMPLAPEKKIPLIKDLNTGQQEYNDGKSPKNKKLIADCKDKKEYVIHERLLLYYIDLGLKIKKVHRIISFREENWLEPYIDLNTDLRTKSKTEFEKNIWKLMNNAFYGKTCENIRNRTDVKFVTSEKQAIKLHTILFIKEKQYL